MSRREKYVAGFGGAAIVVLIGLIIAGTRLSHRIEPFIRDQAEQYLRDRFRADVQIASLRVRLPTISPLMMLFTRGRGTVATVTGEGIVMRMRNHPDSPRLFSIRKFVTTIDVGALFKSPKHVPVVTVTGLEINIPPKGERPDLTPDVPPGTPAPAASNPKVVIDRLDVKQATLSLLPKDKAKQPLTFAIHDIKLQSAGGGVAMKYDCMLTNAKPPGEIHSYGSFGPWNSVEPGDTPLNGSYTFDRANLGVFAGIAGTLQSKGRFEGELDTI